MFVGSQVAQDAGGEGGVEVIEEARNVKQERTSDAAGVNGGARFVT
jgi:hypothetical protein